MKSTKKTLIALAITAALGMSGAANAGVLASSTFSITNFLLSDASTGTTLNAFDFASLVANNNANISSNLAGAALAGGAFNLSIFDPTPTDLTRATSGTTVGTPAENNFMVLTPPPTSGNFAHSDQFLGGSSLQLSPTLPPTTGANAQVRSDVSLTGTGSGAAASNVGLNSTFTFSLTKDIRIGLNFHGAVDLLAFADVGSHFPSNAQASSALTVSLVDAGGNSFINFNNPTGSTGCRLNNTRTVNAPANGTNAYQCIGDFSGTTLLLTAGTEYTFSIRQETAANARLVSEPGVLSLMGLGLLGIGAALRKRKAA